jgi:hypothetical protein
LKYFEEKILAGDLVECEKYLGGFTKINGVSIFIAFGKVTNVFFTFFPFSTKSFFLKILHIEEEAIFFYSLKKKPISFYYFRY